MAGAARRRRRPPDRLAWIRRHSGLKQRGAKLRSSSSESDVDAASKVALKVGGGGDAASKVGLMVGGGGDAASKFVLKVGGGDAASKVGLKVRGGGDAAAKVALKVASDADAASMLGLKVGDGGVGGDEDVSYSPMLGCCSCNLIRKHLVAEEGGCEGTCPRNMGSCDWCGNPKHDGRGRRRFDAKGQLYVLDSEAENSDLEESCRPVIRRGQWALGRRLATTGKVALEAATCTTEATADADFEMTEEMLHFMEQCLTGIEEGDREVFIPWIKVLLLTALLRKIQIKGMANIMNWCISKEARFPCSL